MHIIYIYIYILNSLLAIWGNMLLAKKKGNWSDIDQPLPALPVHVWWCVVYIYHKITRALINLASYQPAEHGNMTQSNLIYQVILDFSLVSITLYLMGKIYSHPNSFEGHLISSNPLIGKTPQKHRSPVEKNMGDVKKSPKFGQKCGRSTNGSCDHFSFLPCQEHVPKLLQMVSTARWQSGGVGGQKDDRLR